MEYFQFILSILGDNVSPELRSGASGIVRNVSSGMQHYETDPSLYPVNKPVEKYEARLQCTGEAIYVNDIPEIPGELHAAFVYSTIANCDLDTVDPTEALAMPGTTEGFWYLILSLCLTSIIVQVLWLTLIIKTYLVRIVPSLMMNMVKTTALKRFSLLAKCIMLVKPLV